MKILRAARLQAVVALMAAHPCTAAMSVEDFARPPEFSNAGLSPDGKTMAYRYVFEGRTALGFLDLKTLKVLGLGGGRTNLLGQQGVAYFHWVSPDRVILMPVARRFYATGYVGVNRDGSQWQPLTGALRTMDPSRPDAIEGNDLVYPLHRDPKRLLFLNWPYAGGERGQYPEVVSVNSYTGAYVIAQKNPGDVKGWFADAKGAIRFALVSDRTSTGLKYRQAVDQPWSKPIPFGTDVQPFRYYGEHEGLIYFAKPSASGQWGLTSLDLQTGESTTLFQHQRYDVESVILSPSDHRLLGVRFHTEGPQHHWFDPGMRAIQQQIDRAHPDLDNEIVSMSDDMKRMLVYSYSDREPGIYSLLDLETQQMQEVARSRRWVKADTMVPKHPIKLRARDGLELHGYLSLPPGRGNKHNPLVAYIHGGPWARDTWEWDPVVQFLASRGYAVLQVDYRGSTGYGEEFLAKGKREIGGAIQDDITDAVKWAMANHLADPKRVAIAGISYGGYSALYALATEPELYRCGIAMAAVSDWNKFTRGAEMEDYDYAYRVWSDRFGDLREAAIRERLSRVSPVKYAGDIKAPLLIMHGEADWIVPVDQSKIMVAALRKAGRPVETLYLPNVAHEVPPGKPGEEFFRKLESFLAAHMPPDPQPLAGTAEAKHP